MPPPDAMPDTWPSIADAKALATRHRKCGVLILTFGAGRYSATSYGMTRADCDAMRAVNKAIADRIESGEIKLPPPFCGE